MKQETRQVRTLAYIRSNGETIEDRRYADQQYYDTVFKLWARHVAKTGQTYYPPLQRELSATFELWEDAEMWS